MLCRLEKRCDLVGIVVRTVRKAVEVMNPDVFVNALRPAALDNFLFALTGVNTVFTQNHGLVVQHLALGCQYAGVSRGNAVINVTDLHRGLEHLKEQQIQRTSIPQEVNKNRLRIFILVKLHNYVIEVLAHEQSVYRNIPVLKVIEYSDPVNVFAVKQ